jgi:hypothetical protein
MNVVLWPIGNVIPYPRNARQIPQSAIDKVAASIQEFGFGPRNLFQATCSPRKRPLCSRAVLMPELQRKPVAGDTRMSVLSCLRGTALGGSTTMPFTWSRLPLTG